MVIKGVFQFEVVNIVLVTFSSFSFEYLRLALANVLNLSVRRPTLDVRF